MPRRRLAEEGDLARQVLHVAHPIHVALVDPLVQLGGLRVQGLSGGREGTRLPDQILQRSSAIVLSARRAKHIQSKNLYSNHLATIGKKVRERDGLRLHASSEHAPQQKAGCIFTSRALPARAAPSVANFGACWADTRYFETESSRNIQP